MATIKNRLNVTLSPDLDRALSSLSVRDQMPRATKAANLLRLALEIEEDTLLEIHAKARDTKNARFISHERAWK